MLVAMLRKLLPLALLASLSAGAAWWAHGQGLLGPQAQAQLQAWLLPLGAWAPFAFLLFKVVAIGLGLPTIPVTLAGGALFGFAGGGLLNLAGGTLGAALPFAFTRRWGRSLVADRLKGRMARWDQSLNQRGFWAVVFLRLVPLVPFNVVNFGSGLTQVSFRAYFAATLLGIVPGVAAFTHLGSSAAEGSWKGILWAFAGLGLLSLIPLLWPRPEVQEAPEGGDKLPPENEAPGLPEAQA